MVGCESMPLNILLELNPGNFKDGEHSFKVSDEKFPAMRKSHNNNMRVVKISGILINFLQSHFVPGVEINVMEHHHELFDHIVDFSGGFYLRGDEYFDWNGIIQNGIELVELFLVVLVYLLFVGDLLIFDCLGHLPLLFGEFLPLLSLFHFELIFLDFSLGVDLNAFHFVFDVMRLHLESLIKLGDGLRLVDYSFGLVLGFVGVGLLDVVLLLAFLPHC